MQNEPVSEFVHRYAVYGIFINMLDVLAAFASIVLVLLMALLVRMPAGAENVRILVVGVLKLSTLAHMRLLISSPL